MINKDQNALSIVKGFCQAFYNERSLDGAFSFLSKNVLWASPNKKPESANYEKLKAMFLIDMSLMKEP